MRIDLPVSDEQLSAMKIGERYELNGEIFTARDAAHKRLVNAIEKGDPLPIKLEKSSIFTTGPCPARPGMAAGSIGATSSSRMDPYVETMLKAGNKIMIGKGARAPYIAELCKKYKAVYLVAYGGAGALYSKYVKEMETICYEDLGTEAVHRLQVEGFKVIVAIDTNGKVLMDENQKEYALD